jgi:hypothetical protein
MNASNISLSAGIFREPTISISDIVSLSISGVQNATIFNCSDRVQLTGAAFSINNSTVNIKGVSFYGCVSPNSDGGALSARGSSIVVSFCSFVNCSAASGGAMSVTGPGKGLYLDVQSSAFERNSAIGGASGCAGEAAQPCSSWGGAIAAFEMPNLTIVGCTMTSNIARASVSLRSNSSRIAVAGGGCVSVLFFGNASDVTVRVSNNRFLQCEVAVSGRNNVAVGNGTSKLFCTRHKHA